MEEYFDKYRGLVEEQEPQMDETEFVRKLRKNQRISVVRISLSMAAVAAAMVLVALIPIGRETMSAGECYIAAFNEGVGPLLDEVKSMEGSSEYCREKGYSTVIEELMSTVAEYAGEGSAKGRPAIDPDTKEYCNRMAKKIKGLYADCVHDYVDE